MWESNEGEVSRYKTRLYLQEVNMRMDSVGRVEFLLEIQKSGADREATMGLHRTPRDGGVDDEVGGGVDFGRRGR